MNLTLADQYYLKALDEYSYNLEITVENLNYALSYDNDHAGANYLLGRLHLEYFNQYEKAETCFINALSTDPNHVDTCKSYASLLIKLRKFIQARRLIHHAYKLTGVNKSVFLRYEALTYELNLEFVEAKALLNKAIFETSDTAQIRFLKDEIDRITDKQSYCEELNYRVIV